MENGSVSPWHSVGLVQLAPINLCVEVFALASKPAHGLQCLIHVITCQTEQVGELADDHFSRMAPRRQNAASCLHNIASYFAVTSAIEAQASKASLHAKEQQPCLCHFASITPTTQYLGKLRLCVARGALLIHMLLMHIMYTCSRAANADQ